MAVEERSMTGYVTAQQAATEHGVSRRRMHQLLQQGRVQGAVKFGRQWCVPLPVLVLPPEPGNQPVVTVLGVPGDR